jgi:hypothetical protein
MAIRLLLLCARPRLCPSYTVAWRINPTVAAAQVRASSQSSPTTLPNPILDTLREKPAHSLPRRRRRRPRRGSATVHRRRRRGCHHLFTPSLCLPTPQHILELTPSLFLARSTPRGHRRRSYVRACASLPHVYAVGRENRQPGHDAKPSFCNPSTSCRPTPTPTSSTRERRARPRRVDDRSSASPTKAPNPRLRGPPPRPCIASADPRPHGELPFFLSVE